MEAEYAATSAFRLGHQQRRGVRLRLRLKVAEQRGKVVVEGEDARVRGVAHSARARVTGAQIARRIVRHPRAGGLLARLALPRTVGALRRHQNPLAQKRIVAAVRNEIERAGRGGQRGSSWEKTATPSSVSENRRGIPFCLRALVHRLRNRPALLKGTASAVP